jgi:hypothetical protein
MFRRELPQHRGVVADPLDGMLPGHLTELRRLARFQPLSDLRDVA